MTSSSEKEKSSGEERKRGSEILAYTCTFGEREEFVKRLIPAARSAAGCWFDWAFYLGAPSDGLLNEARRALQHPERRGIQYLTHWPQNRGQHHATREAFALARERKYRWLVRIDDDLKMKPFSRWLKKMVSRLEKLKELAGDHHHRIVAAPRIAGLRHPLRSAGAVEVARGHFPCEYMEILGGACRIHPVSFFDDFEPDLYDPIGRGDPQQIGKYLAEKGGFMVRFPDIRVIHNTQENEEADVSPEAKHRRKMSYAYPYLGPSDS